MTGLPDRRRSRLGLVRSFALTAGQGVPSRSSMDWATLLWLDKGKTERPGGLEAPEQRVVDLCAGGLLSIAEVAAHLQHPTAAVTVIAASLADAGYLVTRQPIPAADKPDTKLLEQILDGLKAL